MKKKIFNLLAAFVLVFVTGMALTACGNDNSIKFSVENFNDEGVLHIAIYIFPAAGTTEDDFGDSMQGFYQGSQCYANDWMDTGNRRIRYETVKIPQGKWDGYIEVCLEDSHTIGNFGLTVNGETKELQPTDDVMQLLGLCTNSYYVRIPEFSSDLKLKVSGSTQVKTYQQQVVLDGYDENNELHTDLVFKYAKNGGVYSGELNGEQFKAALEAETLTYFDTIDVVMYFKSSENKFAENGASNFGVGAYAFTTEGNQIKWTMDHFNFGSTMTLDYARLAEILEQGF